MCRRGALSSIGRIDPTRSEGPLMPAPPRFVVHLLHVNPVLKAGLLTVLQGASDFDVFDGDDAAPPPPGARDGRGPQVVVADHRGGLALLQASAHAGRCRRVLIVEALSRGWAIRAALQAGVLGYAAVDCPLQELIHGVRCVQRGQRFLCASASQAMADGFSVGDITRRELDVLHLLSAGLDNKSISRELDIALSTVKVHVQALLGKLRATSRTEAAIAAMRLGVVEWSAPGSPVQRPASRPIGHPDEAALGHRAVSFGDAGVYAGSPDAAAAA